eukprot:CAMPEP_0170485622 /NCGR_PEP_ID=MMETSP0208-20121228/4855_1 /TAXON_ID=197538 /ORGANISM="Strombidium inclinatum, Strain S3" /LENGTH=53 /DNA_ID=CAMNT_0010759329 /DNA_START=765 /DNA_END=926 /DNA_ORIENTATION=-
MKDISILKDMLNIERKNNSKHQDTIGARDAEIKELRGQLLERQQEDLLQLNDL